MKTLHNILSYFLAIFAYFIYVADRVLMAFTFRRMHGFEEWGNSVFLQYGTIWDYSLIKNSFKRVSIATFIGLFVCLSPWWLLLSLLGVGLLYFVYLLIKSRKNMKKSIILLALFAFTSCYKPMTCECVKNGQVTAVVTTEWMKIHRKKAVEVCTERGEAMDQGTVCTLLD
jgi:hypothetical protein